MQHFWDIHILLAVKGKVGNSRLCPMVLLAYAYAWVSSQIALQIPLARSFFSSLTCWHSNLDVFVRWVSASYFLCLSAPVSVMYHMF